MYKTVCSIITDRTKEIAKQMNLSNVLTNNLISLWQSQNNSDEYPTVQELKKLRADLRKLKKETVHLDDNNPLAKLSKDMSPLQRKDRGDMLAGMFSDVVDQLVEEERQKTANTLNVALANYAPQQVVQNLVQRLRSFDEDTVRSRQQVIQDLGVNYIIDKVKQKIADAAATPVEQYAETYGEEKAPYIKDSYQKTLDNFDYLMDDALSILESKEHVRIIVDNKTNTSTVALSQEEQDKLNQITEEDENGERANGSEGFSYKIRMLNPYTTLSKKVKDVLKNLVRVSPDGSFETDDLGNVKSLNPEYAHAVLLDELSWMTDPDDFCIKQDDGTYTFPALEALTDKHPWMQQVINALYEDPSTASAFYSDLRKEFTSRWTTRYDEEEGKWKTFPVNAPNALDSTRKQTILNYEEGLQLDSDSIYNAARAINPENASKGDKLAASILKTLRTFSQDEAEEVSQDVSKGLRMIGVNVTPTSLAGMLKAGKTAKVEAAVEAMREIFQGTKKKPDVEHLINAYESQYDIIINNVGEVSEFINNQTFRHGGNDYPNYIAPDYLSTLFKELKDDDKRKAILAQYAQDGWFKHPSTGKWRNELLRVLDSNEQEDTDVRKSMEITESTHYNNKEYTDWLPSDVYGALVSQYFSVPYNPDSETQYARFAFPIFSDATFVKFLKFKKFTGDYESQLIPLFNAVIKQELFRIHRINQRKDANAIEIATYDKDGEKFFFLPELNDTIVTLDEQRMPFLDACITLIKRKDAKNLNNLINAQIPTIIDKNFEEFIDNLKSTGALEDIRKILAQENLPSVADEYEIPLREYFWNQMYMQSQMTEVLTTDLAFYKADQGVTFQKRAKEFIVSGMKLNTNSPYGKKVERMIILKDNVIVSTVYSQVKTILDTAVNEGRIKSFDRDNILYKFRQVNVTDAQAFRTLPSLRSLLDMAGGQWTPAMEESFQRFQSGKWDMADFYTIWQAIKPVVYTQVLKPDGIGGQMMVPQYHKNSETVLLAVYGMVANAAGKSPMIKALNQWMLDNNVDVAQYESAVKVGGQGIIDLNYSPTKLDAFKKTAEWKAVEKAATDNKNDYTKFVSGNTALLEQGKLTQKEFNSRMASIQMDYQEVYDTLNKYAKNDAGEFKPEVVHEIPYKHYSIQQPSSDHLRDTESVFGSQFRNLLVADIPDDPSWKITIHGKQYNKREVIQLWDDLITEDLLDDYEDLKDEFKDINSLKNLLIQSIKNSGSYSRSMIDALQVIDVINPYTGQPQKVFNVPLESLTSSQKNEQIVLSTFKNRITKQFIKGACCVQVSDVGFTTNKEELSVVINEKTGAIEAFECYLPAYSKKFFAALATTKVDKNGVTYQELDINKLPKELRVAIGYRIPTEDKCSIISLRIKGFLPEQNGSTIMLPAEITTIMGSDFDIDKLYMFLPEFSEQTYDVNKAKNYYAKEQLALKTLGETIKDAQEENAQQSLQEIINKIDNSQQTSKDFKDWVEASIKDGDKYGLAFEKPIIRKIRYDVNKAPEEQSRAARHNMLIDISRAVLAHPETAAKSLNPSSFDTLETYSKLNTIITNRDYLEKFVKTKFNIDAITKDNIDDVVKKLLSMARKRDIKAIDTFLDKNQAVRNPLTPQTFEYFQQQNMMGATSTGIYANNTAAQAKFQTTDLGLSPAKAFRMGNNPIQSMHDVYNAEGDRIIKNCAEFQAASVDNAKKPVLANLLMNQNTGNIAGTLTRLGLSIEEVALLFQQPYIADLIRNTGKLDANMLKKRIIENVQAEYNRIVATEGAANMPQFSFINVNTYNFTPEEMLKNIIEKTMMPIDAPQETPKDYVEFLVRSVRPAMLMYSVILPIAEKVNNLTMISRADSMNGAAAITIGGIQTQVRALTAFHRQSKQSDFPLTGLSSIIQNGLVTPSMSKKELRQRLRTSKMQRIQAFYSLGIELPLNLISDYFVQMSPYVESLVKQVEENSATGVISPRILNDLYKEFKVFALLNTRLFGDDENQTQQQKEKYYTEEFPKVFEKLKATNSNIANDPFIKKLTVNKNNQIVMPNSGRKSQPMRDTFMRELTSLLYAKNEVLSNLAIELFKYSFYTERLSFGPESIGPYFDTNFLTIVPDYIETLRWLREEAKPGSIFDKFLPMFYRNHITDKGMVPKIILGKKDSFNLADGTLTLPIGKVANLMNENTEPYQYIKFNTVPDMDQYYQLISASDTQAFYKEIKPLPYRRIKQYAPKLNMEEFLEAYDKVPETQPTRQTSPSPETNITQEVPQSYEGLITPGKNTIFVFGSNPEGRHGAGAAKVAVEKFGAIYGQGEGLQGNAYALPTKDLRVKENKSLKSISPEHITENIRRMYEVANQNPDKLFKVAYTNDLNETTLNGYNGTEMIKMFKDAGPIPTNVVFSKNWTDHWNEIQSNQTQQNLPGPKTVQRNIPTTDFDMELPEGMNDAFAGLESMFDGGEGLDQAIADMKNFDYSEEEGQQRLDNPLCPTSKH